MNFALITGAALAVIAVVAVVRGVRIVPQAETTIVERLGRYHRTLNTGLNIIWPILDRPAVLTWRERIGEVDGRNHYVDRPTTRIDLREQVFDFPGQSVITKDNVSVTINAVLYFRIVDPYKVAYEISNLPDAVEKLTQTTLRNIMGELELDDALTSREKINGQLQSVLDEVTGYWGVKVTRVELQEITPPEDVLEAMEKQMRAERSKRAAILTAEGERESQIARAEGEKRSAILTAEGQSQARKAIAEAEAEAITRVTEALQASDADPSHYLLGMRSIEGFEKLAESENQKLVFVPTEATKTMAALGSIPELLGKNE